MITLPNNFIPDLISTMSGTITDIMPLVLLILGVFLGVYIIRNLFWDWIDRQNGLK